MCRPGEPQDSSLNDDECDLFKSLIGNEKIKLQTDDDDDDEKMRKVKKQKLDDNEFDDEDGELKHRKKK